MAAKNYNSERGTVHIIISVLLRLAEIACGAIVLGILATFVDRVNDDSGNVDSRVIYALSLGCITVAYSIICLPPINKLFYGFPLDWSFFIMWLVAFCLLETRTGTDTCDAGWYYDYWGYYWGRHWHYNPYGPVPVSGDGCGEWRTVLAFSFIASIMHLLSGVLGIYVFLNYLKGNRKTREKSSKRHSGSTASPDTEANLPDDQAPPPMTAAQE